MEFDKEQLAPDHRDAINGVVAKAFPECDWGAISHVPGDTAARGLSVHNRLRRIPIRSSPQDIPAAAKVALCATIYDERIALCATAPAAAGRAASRFWADALRRALGYAETPAHQ